MSCPTATFKNSLSVPNRALQLPLVALNRNRQQRAGNSQTPVKCLAPARANCSVTNGLPPPEDRVGKEKMLQIFFVPGDVPCEYY